MIEARVPIADPDIEDTRSAVKQGDASGEILYKRRGDGTVKKNWEDAKNTEDPKPQPSGGSSLQGAWLRERLVNSNHAF